MLSNALAFLILLPTAYSRRRHEFPVGCTIHTICCLVLIMLAANHVLLHHMSALGIRVLADDMQCPERRWDSRS